MQKNSRTERWSHHYSRKILVTLQAASESVVHRPRSFEFLGTQCVYVVVSFAGGGLLLSGSPHAFWNIWPHVAVSDSTICTLPRSSLAHIHALFYLYTTSSFLFRFHSPTTLSLLSHRLRRDRGRLLAALHPGVQHVPGHGPPHPRAEHVDRLHDQGPVGSDCIGW